MQSTSAKNMCLRIRNLQDRKTREKGKRVKVKGFLDRITGFTEILLTTNAHEFTRMFKDWIPAFAGMTGIDLFSVSSVSSVAKNPCLIQLVPEVSGSLILSRVGEA